jgi:betaine-aldehyde dehydrogenase
VLVILERDPTERFTMTMPLTATTGTSPVGNWIDGQWNFGGTVHESVDPSTGQVVGAFHSAGAAEAEAAIGAARKAFDTTDWSRAVAPRAQALNELADNLARRIDDLARTVSRETGRLAWETMMEAKMAVDLLRLNAARARVQIAGQAIEQAPGMYWHSVPEAAGVAGIISPWNGPLLLSIRSIGPALAAGCTAVVKLPGQTALSNALLAAAVAETTAIPSGVLSILTEAGNEVAPRLVSSPEVDVLSYTGSTAVGRLVAAGAAPTVKRMILELGGKSPLVVFDDVNVDAVVRVAVRASTFMNGQYCATGSRVLVHRAVADEFRVKLTAALQSVRVGPADDPASQLGPLIDKAAVERVDRLVEEAAGYAKVLVRGGIPEEPELRDGAYFRPALIETDHVDVPIVQQEVFGPVQTFEVFEDEADAIRRANATEFGLAAAVFSADDLRARRVGRELRVSTVWLNNFGMHTQQMAGTPVKQSGYGSLAGSAAIEAFQNTKRYGTAMPPA